MAKSVPQPRMRAAWGKRFSLRVLFIVSGLIALPFLVLANLRHGLRPEESVASPLYLLLGIAGVVVAAAIGSAMGSRTGMFAAAGLAAFSWVGAVYLCGLFSKELQAVLPVHGLFAGATMAVLALVVWSAKKPEEDGPHDKLLRLLKVKHDVQEARRTKGDNAPKSEQA